MQALWPSDAVAGYCMASDHTNGEAPVTRRAMVTAMLMLAAAGAAAAQERQAIHPPGTATRGPYAPAVRIGGLVYASGQVGIAPGAAALVPGGVRAEVRQALENLDRVFRAAGTSLARAVKCTVFLADMADFAAMNEVYVTFFPDGPPARSTIGDVVTPVSGARVEIECIAAMP